MDKKLNHNNLYMYNVQFTDQNLLFYQNLIIYKLHFTYNKGCYFCILKVGFRILNVSVTTM